MTDELAEDALIPAGLAAAAFSAVAAPVVVLDAEGTIVQVNPACARLCACEPDRLRRRSWQSLADPEQAETLRQMLASPGSVGAPVSHEMRWGLPGAERRTVVWSYCAVTDGPGERPCVIATGSDVTEARATEQALRESDACFRQLTENIREVFFIRDVRHNRKLYVSPAYEQIWGRPVQALYDDPEEFLRSVHPEDRGRVEAAMQTQTPDRLLDEEYRIVRPDGAQRWIRARAFPVLDEEGELSCVAGIAEDITHRRQAEDAVKDSEAQLRQIIDLVPHMIFVKDWEGRFLLVNEAKAQVFGTTVEALTGRTQAQLGGDPVQLRQMLADDREVMASGRLKFVPEEIFTDVAGHQRVLETLKMPYVVAGQAARAVLGVATDITDRKRMERALVAEEEKYRSVVEALAEGVALIGADELIYACNPSVARILDVPMEALIGCRWYQVDWRRRGEDGASLNRDRHPIAVALRTGQRFSEVVMRLERPSRRVTWVSINIRPLLRDRDPQPSAVVVSLHDITAQKEMEAALRASEAKYRALMEGASDGILVTDSEGRLLDSNRRVQDLLGYAPEELKGLAAADIYPGGELREVLSMFSRILSSGPAMRQSWLLRKDGVCVPVEMAANTIEYHGVRVVQSIFRDLRERREAELQTAKLSGAVEQTADAVMITDRHGTIEYVNPAFQAITGYAGEDVVGNTPGLLRSGRMDRQFYA
ncbi:MAG TPA: PAS domain S-box protein, partial [Gammaproteobacteria bacterium]|nr:PAS domain S-box protein [Gammaproteobacteria bacterium]